MPAIQYSLSLSVGRGTACKAYLQRRSAHPQAARLLQHGQALLQLGIAQPCKALVSGGLPAAQVYSAILHAIAAMVSTCSTPQRSQLVPMHELHYSEASRTLRAISCQIGTQEERVAYRVTETIFPAV